LWGRGNRFWQEKERSTVLRGRIAGERYIKIVTRSGRGGPFEGRGKI